MGLCASGDIADYQTANTSTDVVLEATSDGSPAPAFQWLKNGTNITGATNSTLNLGNVTLADSATYNAIATNDLGWALSNDIILTVADGVSLNVSPVFTTQPASQNANYGATVTLTAAASGTPTPSFQWQKNDVPVFGATQATLTLNAVTTADTATYSVVATNVSGVVTSTRATLLVNSQVFVPAIVSSQTAGTVGKALSYTISATNSPVSYSVTGLPLGLVLNSVTGVISGTPLAAGSFSLGLGATNSAGTGTATLTLTIAAANTPSEYPSNSWITSANGSSSYSIGAGEIGLRFQVGAKNITITALGFQRSNGTYSNSSIKLRNSAGILATQVVLSSDVAVGAFAYATLAAPVVLNAGEVYWITFDGSGYNGFNGFNQDIYARMGLATTAVATLLGCTDASGNVDTVGAVVDFKYATIAPTVTSSQTSGTYGSAFRYSISGTNTPTSYTATGLPLGLTLNSSTGVISGTPLVTGSFSVGLGATNSGGTGTATLTLTIEAANQVGNATNSWVTSAIGSNSYAIASGETGLRFKVGGQNVTLTALGFQRSSGTASSPIIKLRNRTGVLATQAVSYSDVSVGGFAYATLAAPVVLNAGETYWITFDGSGYNGFNGFNADVYARMGLATSGVATLLGCTDASGNADSVGAVVDFKYATSLAPSITSAQMTGVSGSAFSYTITSSNSPTIFTATGLPTGLTLNSSTGVISGTPVVTGSFSVALGATNSGGTGTATLNLTITAAASNQPLAWVGSSTGTGSYAIASGETGLRFTVGDKNITITELGFQRSNGTNSNPTIKLRSSAGVLAAQAVSYADVAVGTFAYATLAAPVMLNAGETYWITLDASGYNGFNGFNADVYAKMGLTTTGAATLLGCSDANGNMDTVGALVDFKYVGK